MKHHWFIHLTRDQFQKLQQGLLSRFRFQLRLEIATVEYSFEKNTLSVYIPDGVKSDIKESISCYINGFSAAIGA